MKTNREKLSEVLEKRGYKNEDLINEIEQIYNKQQLPIHGVSKSFAVGKEVVIVGNKHGHQFALGEKVTLLKQEEDGEWKAINDKNEHWWIEEIEANVC
jgi:hypothetical protein